MNDEADTRDIHHHRHRRRRRRRDSAREEAAQKRTRWQQLPFALRQKILFWSLGLGSGLIVVLVMLKVAVSMS